MVPIHSTFGKILQHNHQMSIPFTYRVTYKYSPAVKTKYIREKTLTQTLIGRHRSVR